MGKVKSALVDSIPTPEADSILPVEYGGTDAGSKKSPERVLVGDTESKRLDDWIEVVDKKFQGFIKVTKSDLVNFLIRDHHEQLSRDELERIKRSNYDEGRFLTWAVSKWKESQKIGDHFKMTDIFETYKTVFDKTSVKPSGKTKKETDKVLAANGESTTSVQNNDSVESKS